MSIKKIEQLEDKSGFIVFTDRVLLNSEVDAIKSELKRISAQPLGHLFFRVA